MAKCKALTRTAVKGLKHTNSKLRAKNSQQNYLVRCYNRLDAVKAIVCIHLHCRELSAYIP